MTKDEAINIVQTFLDKSSHAKWKRVQLAIDFLKQRIDYLEESNKGNYEIWHDGNFIGAIAFRKDKND